MFNNNSNNNEFRKPNVNIKMPQMPKVSFLPLLLVLFLLLLPLLNNFWISLSWFKEVGYSSVFLKNLLFKLSVGVGIFLLTLALSFFTLLKTVRSIPDTYIEENDIIDISMSVRKPNKKKILSIAGLYSFLISFLFTGPIWKDVLLFINQVSFNLADPLFNKDIGFYFFTMPLIENILSPLLFVSVTIILLNAVIYVYYYRRRENLAENLFHKFGLLIAVFFLLLIANFYIQALNLVHSSSGSVYGAGFTDVHVSLNLYYLKMALALLSALSIIIGLKKKNLKLALAGPLILFFLTFAGGFVELGVQNFLVNPNELSKEEAYIKRSIDYTQIAYNLDQVEKREFPALWNLSAHDIEEAANTIKNIRINDFRPTQAIYNQLQSIRLYYQFSNISIDRYTLDGQQRQVFLSAREMDHSRLPDQAKNWINQHLKFTHGYGVAISPVNKITAQGQPQLIVKNIPPESEYEELIITKPEIYFGNLTDNYIIINTDEKEFNYPTEDDNAETVYSGQAGIKLNLLNKFAFSIDNKTPKILLSGAINNDSKIIINRNISDRVKKIAPFLKYESEPYLVIDDGRLFWMIDGYTTSSRFPYSQPVYSGYQSYNYIRNSVKVVIDAYEGTTDFYIYDTKDPVIMTYNNVYPGLFKDASLMPQTLREHVKYPVELFDIQSSIFSIYHMDNPRTFFNREDAWSIATEKYDKDLVTVRPYYITMALPGSDEAEFVLVQPYTAYKKNNMVSWFAALNDGDNYGKLLVYTFPKQRLIYGPMQIESRIDQDATISSQLTLWERQGSSVVRGNLMVIPIKDSLLYVEPLYLQSDNANALPEVKQIILAYGDDIIMEATLEAGLERLFAYKGASSEPAEKEDGSISVDDKSLAQLIDKANRLFDSSQENLRQGNWTAYGRDLDELEKVLKSLDSYK